MRSARLRRRKRVCSKSILPRAMIAARRSPSGARLAPPLPSLLNWSSPPRNYAHVFLRAYAPSRSPQAKPRRASASRWSTGQKFGAIAASVAILALSASLLLLWNRLNDLQRQYEREHKAVEVLAKQVSEEREIRELLTAPGAQMAQLAGTNAAQQAS